MKIKLVIIVAFTLSTALISCTSREQKARNLVKEGIEDNKYLRYEDAFQKFDKAIKLKDDLPQAYYYRGNYYYNSEQYNEAFADFDKAISLDSNYADAYFNRGLIKKMNNNEKGACQDWLKAERLGKPNMEDKTRWCK